MLKITYKKAFEKDVKLAKKRGKDLDKLQEVLQLLTAEKPLNPKYKDHVLVGNFHHRRECHIEPNWLLIYKKESQHITFERTGSHSDLFK